MEMSYEVHFVRRDRGRVDLVEGVAPVVAPRARVPARIARLVALAHYVEGLVRAGTVRDYADVASLAGITRARMSQITSLLNLAPDIQAELLEMVKPERGREITGETQLRLVVRELDWNIQRKMFRALMVSVAQ
jgi:hypothetical protein